MPCIQTKVSVPIPAETEEKLKTRFGKAIALLPGKSEEWLMLTFEDNCRLYFQGKKEPGAAFVAVKLYGKAGNGAYDALTKELTAIVSEELRIRPDRIYIQYEETDHWGWNGGNF